MNKNIIRKPPREEIIFFYKNEKIYSSCWVESGRKKERKFTHRFIFEFVFKNKYSTVKSFVYAQRIHPR